MTVGEDSVQYRKRKKKKKPTKKQKTKTKNRTKKKKKKKKKHCFLVAAILFFIGKIVITYGLPEPFGSSLHMRLTIVHSKIKKAKSSVGW